MALHAMRMTKDAKKHSKNVGAKTLALSVVVLTGVAIGAGPLDLGKEIVDLKMARMAEGQAAWMASMTPGKAHEFLRVFEGEWDVAARLMMGEGAPPMDSSWTSSARSTMGGRYIESRGEGTMLGMDVESLMIMGFDNERELFHLTMFDTTATGVRTMYGNLDRTGRVLTFVGGMDEPMTGELNKPFKITWTLHGEDHHTYEIQEILYGEPFTVVRAEVRRKK
ncbi:MAG: DUF1579 family protein [Planctomycetota bacterium]